MISQYIYMSLYKKQMVKMKGIINIRAISIVGISAIILLSGIATAYADTLGGGDSCENAIEIFSGHNAEAVLDKNSVEYFYITVNSGQMLVVKGAVLSGRAICQSILNEDGFEMNTHTFDQSGILKVSLNSEMNNSKLYLRIANTHYGSTEYVLNVSIEDHYDTNSGTDAGDTFDTAMNVSQGSYDGFLSGNYKSDGGSDNKDLYKLSLESGENVTVKLTPPDDVKLGLTIYDEDRAEVDYIESPETGVITRASWTAPFKQDIYILIKKVGEFPSGTYHMDISVEPLGEHGLTITSFETPPTAAQGSILKTNLSITKNASFESWYTVVVSGVDDTGHPVAGTALIKIGCDSAVIPVWINIPPEARTGNYNLFADVYTANWDYIADTGPQIVQIMNATSL